MAYKTPGVYVKEISLFPPSVAEVETAIPVFIGYTEKAIKKGEDITDTPTRIKSLLEFHELFGGEFTIKKVTVKLNDTYAVTSVKADKRFYLYESLRLFFNNGGGKCYIVSVGNYNDTIKMDALSKGITEVEKYDEPTMILFPDAQLLSKANKDQLYSLQQQTLLQCATLQDRVGVFDLYEGDGSKVSDAVSDFRDKIGINNLKYGAAYTPWLYSSLPKQVSFDMFASSVTDQADKTVDLTDISSPELNNLVVAMNNAEADRTAIQTRITTFLGTLQGSPKSLEDAHRALYQKVGAKADYDAYTKFIDDLIVELEKWKSPVISDQLALDTAIYLTQTLAPVKAAIADEKAKNAQPPTPASNKAIAAKIALHFSGAKKSLLGFIHSMQDAAKTRSEMAQTILYEQHTIIGNIVNHIKKEMSKVPPSGAIAGVYATVDNNRGVWKAPANVSLNSVLGPVEAIDNADQETLNVDVNSGKSVNAIRAFSGKGTMVWGARTLAGNDNEWRYISVRRFYNMVEESVKKSTSWAVFEPNAKPLWVKVKGMIDNYLVQKWREGALAGATPEEAFFVKIGLGQTMTAQDILEGRLIVEIGMAVVRPAEFIILKFSHKLQES